MSLARRTVKQSQSQTGEAARRIVGTGGMVCALVALGLAPLETAPTAQADFGFEDVVESLIDSFSATSAPIWDFGGWLDASAAAATDPLAAADQGLVDVYSALYGAIHGFGEVVVATRVFDLINPLFAYGDSCGLICHGVGAHLDDAGNVVAAGDGGWLFGDGGSGVLLDQNGDVVIGAAGTVGGDAGLIGNGGVGGNGAAASLNDGIMTAATAGLNGGTGGQLMGNGGSGGAGGAGWVGADGDYAGGRWR